MTECERMNENKLRGKNEYERVKDKIYYQERTNENKWLRRTKWERGIVNGWLTQNEQEKTNEEDWEMTDDWERI